MNDITREQFINIPVEEKQILKIFLSIDNTENHVNVFLYGADDKIVDQKLMSSKLGFKTRHLTALLDPEVTKVYKLKLVYDELDSADSCPLYSLRIAMKPIDLLLSENLKCKQNDLPPDQVNIEGGKFLLEQQFSMSSSFIKLFYDEQSQSLTYDIDLDFENADYFFDAQLRHDFLTANMDMRLLIRGSTDIKKSKLVAVSHWVNQ